MIDLKKGNTLKFHKDSELIARDDLVKFHHDTWRPQGMILAVSGDVDTKRVLASLEKRFAGWKAALFTGNPGLALRVGIRARKTYTLYNGSLACRLFLIDVAPERYMRPSRPKGPGTRQATAGGAVAEMLANRLRKNVKTLGGWARRSGVSCYRIYDADLPEYAVAVDLYP